MKPYTFPIQIVEQDGGGYYVTCPTLPGCHSQGESVEAAKANISEAIELVLEDMRANGEPIPEHRRTLTDTVTIAR